MSYKENELIRRNDEEYFLMKYNVIDTGYYEYVVDIKKIDEKWNKSKYLLTDIFV